MNSILVKLVSQSGASGKLFRAHQDWPGSPSRYSSLKITLSSTADPARAGAWLCAVKTFIKLVEPQAERAEIETRVALVEISPDLWRARLEAKV